MKNQSKSIFFLLIALLSIGFVSCEKDTQKITQNQEQEVLWTAEDVKITNAIHYFQNKVKNNTFKSGETLGIDSALWYIEAMLNYNYSTPDSSFVNLTMDTTFIYDLAVVDEEVSYDEVAAAAFAMEQHIIDYYNQMPNAIKFIIATDVSLRQDGFKNGINTLSITTGYGSEYVDNPTVYTPFGANDYWMYGEDMGGCEINMATESDAAQEIAYKINNPNAVISPPYGTYIAQVVMLNGLHAADYPNDEDEIPNDNMMDYLMYYQAPSLDYPNSFHYCLSPIEMNFYLQGTLDVVHMELQSILDNHPNENWEFLSINLEGLLEMYNYESYLVHIADISYGQRVIDPNR